MKSEQHCQISTQIIFTKLSNYMDDGTFNGESLISSPGITHWLNQTILPPTFPDHSPLPTDHLEPGYFTLVPPYIVRHVNPATLKRYEYYRSYSDNLVRDEDHDKTIHSLNLLKDTIKIQHQTIGKLLSQLDDIQKKFTVLSKRQDIIKSVVEGHGEHQAEIAGTLNHVQDLIIPIFQVVPSLYCKVDSFTGSSTSFTSSKRKRKTAGDKDEKEAGEDNNYTAWVDHLSSLKSQYTIASNAAPILIADSEARAAKLARMEASTARGLRINTTTLVNLPHLVRDLFFTDDSTYYILSFYM